MTKRADGKGKRRPRDPNGWYVETRSVVQQLAEAIDFSSDGVPDLIWDPACGGGMIPGVMLERGHPVIGSDIIDRPRWHWGGRKPWTFYRGNFLQVTKWPSLAGHRLSIICNPPYNEPAPMIAEAFVHRALNMIPFHRAAFIVPIEFACGQGRYRDLYSKHRPSHICFFTERPSMPPGEELLAHGESCRGGGMQDYIAVVFTEGGPHRTEALFLKPSALDALPDIPRRLRRGSHEPSGSARIA